MTDIRKQAVLIITSAVRDKGNFSRLLSKAQAKLEDKRDRNFLHALCFGVARYYIQLSSCVDALLNKPLKKKDHDIHVLLVVGLYQQWYMDTPGYAVVSSAVDTVRGLDKPWATGLVNRILRMAQDQQEALTEKFNQNPETRYSHPAWLIEALTNAWPDDWEAICAANNEPAPLTLRVQTEKIERKAYCDLLDAAEIEWQLPDGAEQAVCLTNPPSVTDLPGYESGLFYVQDLAGQRVVDLLDLEPNLRVLDACAAPGSKTTHIVTRMPELEALVAVDCQPERLAMVTENLQRLQLQKAPVKLVLADALRPQQWWDGQLFDRILVDAPCTATGVIRRHPDIRLRRQPEDLQERPLLQQQLLMQLWPLLKPGGLLVYTTCSVLPEENDQVVKKFLQSDSSAKLKNQRIPDSLKTTHGRQLLPSKYHDGFYYARLQKSVIAD